MVDVSRIVTRENAVAAGVDGAYDRMQRLEDRAAQRAVDEAIRRGLQRSFGQQQPGAGPTAGVPVTQSAVMNEAAPGSLPPPVPVGASAIPPPTAAPEPQAAPGGGAPALPLPPAPMPEPRGGGAMPGTAPTAAPTIPASTGATPQATARPLAGVQENVLRELAGVRGGGAAALNMIQRGGAGQQRQLERDERMAMMALQRGDLATYRFYAARSGIELPEEVLNNAAQRRLIGDAGLMAGRFYPRQQGQQQRFIQAYLQTGGDLSAARAAAGTPGAGGGSGGRQPPQPRPTRQSQVWRQGANPGEEELVMVDPTNPNAPASPVMDQSGAPVVRQRGGTTRAPGEGFGPNRQTNPLLEQMRGAVMEWDRNGRQGPPPLPEGVRLEDVLFGPQYATQGLRNQGTTETTNARIQARLDETQRRIDATAALAAQNNEARANLARIQGDLRSDLQFARDDAARERAIATADAAMERLQASLAARGGQVAGPRATAEPRVGARQQQEQMLIRAGVDPQEAARIAGGAQASANTVASVYARLAGSGASQADVDKAMEVFGPNWRQRLGGAAAVAPPAPAPAAPPQPSWWQRNNPFGSSAPRVAPQEAPAPAAPIGQSGMQADPPMAGPQGIPQRPLGVPPGSQWNPGRQQFRDPMGRLYDRDGNPVQF
jgi:hypothetical protein